MAEWNWEGSVELERLTMKPSYQMEAYSQGNKGSIETFWLEQSWTYPLSPGKGDNF